MKIVAVVLVLLVAAGGYGTWTFRQRALEGDVRLAQQATSSRSAAERLQSELSAERAGAEGLRKDLEAERAKAASLGKELEAEQGKLAEAAAAASTLAEVLAGYCTLIDARDHELLPTCQAVIRTQQAVAQTPSADRFDAFSSAIASAQRAAAKTLEAAESLRARLAGSAGVLDATKAPRAAIEQAANRAAKGSKAVSAAADATARSLRKSTCPILANEEWQASEASVEKGELVAVVAQGRWRWGESIGNAVGPEGEDGPPRYRVVSNWGNGALIARIRGSEQLHRGVPLLQPDRPGKLEFRINDSHVADNGGSLDVTVWIFVPFQPSE